LVISRLLVERRFALMAREHLKSRARCAAERAETINSLFKSTVSTIAHSAPASLRQRSLLPKMQISHSSGAGAAFPASVASGA
jgi:hypothetical protein